MSPHLAHCARVPSVTAVAFVVALLAGCGGAGANASPSAPTAPAAPATAASASTAGPATASSAAPAPTADDDAVQADTLKPVDAVADASGQVSFPAPSIANHPTHPTLHMQLPKGTRVHSEGNYTRVSLNPHFDFYVNVGVMTTDAYPDSMQSSIKNLKVVSKDNDTVVYSGIESRKKDDGSGDEETRDGFHFLVTKEGFQCDDMAAVDLTRKDVDAMVKACQSLSLDGSP
jgi:hypothetical protein